jgi:hypothetical protein
MLHNRHHNEKKKKRKYLKTQTEERKEFKRKTTWEKYFHFCFNWMMMLMDVSWKKWTKYYSLISLRICREFVRMRVYDHVSFSNFRSLIKFSFFLFLSEWLLWLLRWDENYSEWIFFSYFLQTIFFAFTFSLTGIFNLEALKNDSINFEEHVL